jgi:hypothetical protein
MVMQPGTSPSATIVRKPGILRKVFQPKNLLSSDGELDMQRYFSRYLLVHTHIAKTGGSTFVTQLRSIVGEEHVYDMRGGHPAPVKLPREQLANIWVLSGHFWFDTQERPIARRKRYLVNVRDPIDRFVSLYNYVAAAKSHPGHNKYGVLDIDSAFRYLKENSPNAISNTVCQMFGERAFNAHPRRPGRAINKEIPVPFEQARDIMEKNYALVIPTKRLDDAIQGLGKAFGLSIPAVAHENIGTKKVTAISEETRQELRAMNTEDYKLNEHFEAQFDQHLKDLPTRLLG